MRKFTLIMAILITTGYFAYSQTGWTMVDSGLPSGNGVGNISVGMNDNTALWGLAIDDEGHIIDAFTRSIDGGNTWEAGTFNAGDGLSQLFAIDATTCWAVFNTGSTQGLYKTTDGGATWAKQGTAYGSSSFANVIHFFDDMNGFAQGDPVGGYYELYTTTDGGTTWTRVPEADIPAPTSGEYGITGNYCAFGDNIWWGTNQGRIYRSNDKGYTWEVSLTVFGASETVSSLMFNELNGIAYRSYLNIGVESVLNETTDGGATWTEFNTTGAAFARFISHVPGTTNTIYGSAHNETNGEGISISTDGGHNWTEISSGYPFMGSAWLDINTGWCGTLSSGDGTDGMYIYGVEILPPLNLDATIDVLDVLLTWEAPGGTRALLGYNVYRNEVKINDAIVTGLEYLDTDLEIASYEYYVTAVYDEGESEPSNIVQVIITDVSELTEDMFSIYPNPATDILRLKGNSKILHFRLLNTLGQVVIDQEVNALNTEFDVSNLTKGVYVANIETENGNTTRKVIVE